MCPPRTRPAPLGSRRGLQAERLVEVRHVPAGDGHGLVGLRVGGEEQRSLEARFYLPDAAEIDQEPAVDAEEPLAFELLFEPVEATTGSPQRSSICPQPNIVAVDLGIANLARIEHDPPPVPHSAHAAGDRACLPGGEER